MAHRYRDVVFLCRWMDIRVGKEWAIAETARMCFVRPMVRNSQEADVSALLLRQLPHLQPPQDPGRQTKPAHIHARLHAEVSRGLEAAGSRKYQGWETLEDIKSSIGLSPYG